MSSVKLLIIAFVLLTVIALLAMPAVHEWRQQEITEEDYRQVVRGMSHAAVVELLGAPTRDDVENGGGSVAQWRRSETQSCFVIRIRFDEAGRVVNHTFETD